MDRVRVPSRIDTILLLFNIYYIIHTVLVMDVWRFELLHYDLPYCGWIINNFGV